MNSLQFAALYELLISGREGRASATKAIDSSSIPGLVKPKSTVKKMVGLFTASLVDVQHLKGQCEAFVMCGRQQMAA